MTNTIRKVYIGNLNSDVRVSDLEAKFKKFGPIKDCWIHHTGNYGFVEYTHVDDADDAIDAMNGSSLCGVTIKAQPAREPRAHRPVYYGRGGRDNYRDYDDYRDRDRDRDYYHRDRDRGRRDYRDDRRDDYDRHRRHRSRSY